MEKVLALILLSRQMNPGSEDATDGERTAEMGKVVPNCGLGMPGSPSQAGPSSRVLATPPDEEPAPLQSP